MNMNDIIEMINKQIEKWENLYRPRNIAWWKSRKATNITLLDKLFGKNNEFSREFQKMDNEFLLSRYWEINSFDHNDYDSYIITWKMILSNASDLFKNTWKYMKLKSTKQSTKEQPTIINKNTNIITQTQATNINIDNVLRNELRWKEYTELDKILQEKNGKAKWKKVLDFLKELWSETLAKIVKWILLWN